jgi:aspartate aminotransferase, mitochondrial
LSQLKILIRPMYSNPPIHGARIVETIMEDPELMAIWRDELKQMAGRMQGMRSTLVEELKALGSKKDWSHLVNQIGMMAYTGLNKAQVDRLKNEFHIYMTADGRAAVTGLNSKNVAHVAQGFHAVTSS